MNHYSIGQLAKLTNNTVVTLRYYEKLDLIGKIKRGPGGFRIYPESLVPRLYFIKNAKAVGFNLEEIKMLLMLQKNRSPSLSVKKKTQEKIHTINEKIYTLSTMKDALSKWEQACDGKIPIDKCPILENLYKQPNENKD